MPQTEVLVKNHQQEPVDQRRLTKAVEKSLQVERFSKSAEISIVLTDDEEMRRLNREYRATDRSTDVLAFSQLEGEFVYSEGEAVALGDVIISVETAGRQAAERGHPLEDEMDLLVVHGVLHLLGHDDETELGAADMRRLEKFILDELKHERAA